MHDDKASGQNADLPASSSSNNDPATCRSITFDDSPHSHSGETTMTATFNFSDLQVAETEQAAADFDEYRKMLREIAGKAGTMVCISRKLASLADSSRRANLKFHWFSKRSPGAPHATLDIFVRIMAILWGDAFAFYDYQTAFLSFTPVFGSRTGFFGLSQRSWTGTAAWLSLCSPFIFAPVSASGPPFSGRRSSVGQAHRWTGTGPLVKGWTGTHDKARHSFL